MLVGSASAPTGLDTSDVKRQPWETERQYNSRARFVSEYRREHGVGENEEERMRQARNCPPAI